MYRTGNKLQKKRLLKGSYCFHNSIGKVAVLEYINNVQNISLDR